MPDHVRWQLLSLEHPALGCGLLSLITARYWALHDVS
jgi:hypothetical protein